MGWGRNRLFWQLPCFQEVKKWFPGSPSLGLHEKLNPYTEAIKKIRYEFFLFCSWFCLTYINFTRLYNLLHFCVNPGFMWWVTAPWQVPCVPFLSHNNWISLHASSKRDESMSPNQCSALKRPCISTWYPAAYWSFVSDIVWGASKLIKPLCKGPFFKVFLLNSGGLQF